MAILKKFTLLVLISILLTGCSTLNLFGKNNAVNKSDQKNIAAKEVSNVTNNLSTTTTANATKLTVLKLTLHSSATINPNSDNNPSPLVLIIYQLKDNVAFNMADFFTLYQDSKTSLAADLLDQQQVIIAPNQTQQIQLKLNTDTQYLGVIAAFSNITQATWRATLPIASNANITINVTKLALSIKEAK